MLCCENDDDSAALHATLLSSASIAPSELLPWNGYPWYRHETGESKPPTTAQREAGVDPLRQLIELAPRLRVVMLHGGIAKDVWARFDARHRSISRRFHVVPTYHTGARVFMVKEPQRTARLRRLYESFAEVAGLLRDEDAVRVG